eukprot:TRINITY_DN3698_c0_g1_i6.p1 TRINITY_DN3698_c0_g1~~TRINITY_DN3698_c0_g1_i6.p1  ORF type:complete len:273 (-),score=63.93 TRINITY_DN3698_c0_g1_i6:79-897(-)
MDYKKENKAIKDEIDSLPIKQEKFNVTVVPTSKKAPTIKQEPAEIQIKAEPQSNVANADKRMIRVDYQKDPRVCGSSCISGKTSGFFLKPKTKFLPKPKVKMIRVDYLKATDKNKNVQNAETEKCFKHSTSKRPHYPQHGMIRMNYLKEKLGGHCEAKGESKPSTSSEKAKYFTPTTTKPASQSKINPEQEKSETKPKQKSDDPKSNTATSLPEEKKEQTLIAGLWSYFIRNWDPDYSYLTESESDSEGSSESDWASYYSEHYSDSSSDDPF